MRITVNGKQRDVDASPTTPLLYVLRNDLRLFGPKFGCGVGLCGACTVLMGGSVRRSCITPLSATKGIAIEVLDGWSSDRVTRALQDAFVAEQAAQCGYCAHGMIMSAKSLLAVKRAPSRAQICTALDGNLCRCGTHVRIIRAVERAAAGLIEAAG
jgi:nicotinate dehydrogenase subunit A